MNPLSRRRAFAQIALITAAIVPAGLAARADDDADLCMPPAENVAVQAQTPPPTPQNPQNPPPPAEPAPRPRLHLYAGPDIGVFIPTSGRTRNAFGGAWFDAGIGLGAIAHLKQGGRIAPDLHILSQVANGNRLFFGLVGLD